MNLDRAVLAFAGFVVLTSLVLAQLFSPLWLWLAARAGRCYRETPVTCRFDDGTLVEGTVDLAYSTGDVFVVVDFKTDRAEGEVLDRYPRQVGIYADAIARAMGMPARAILMKI